MTTRVAAFDVDGTLTTNDCVVPFMRQIAGVGSVGWGLAQRVHRLLPALVRRDRDVVKAIATAATFTGRDALEVAEAAEVFAHHVADNGLRQDMRAVFDRHRTAGDTIVLVSASFEVYLVPLADRLGAAGVCAARLEVVDGTLSGRLLGANCRGPEKVIRLHAWLDEWCGGRSNTHVTAYGDSTGDREMLLDADEAHWVGAGAVPSWFPS